MRLGLKKEGSGYNNEAIGRSRGGLTSKIHCVVDGLGNPVDFILTGGEVHDSVCANDLLGEKKADFILADKAYDSDKILDKIRAIGAVAVIPPKSNRVVQREYDKDYYKERNLVERFFLQIEAISWDRYTLL